MAHPSPAFISWQKLTTAARTLSIIDGVIANDTHKSRMMHV